MSPAVPESAGCAHQDPQAALQACARCGAFVCAACRVSAPCVPGQVLCAPCRPRASEELRRSLLRREADLRFLGAICYVQAAMIALVSLYALVVAFRAPQALVLSALFVLFAGAMAWVGGRLRRFDEQVLPSAHVLLYMSVLKFPLGTLLGAWGLHVLHGRASRLILSAPYAEVRALAPMAVPVSRALYASIALVLLTCVMAFFFEA